MNEEQKKYLKTLFPGRVLLEHPMARCTTFRTGGKADAFLEVLDEEELCRLLPWLSKEDLPCMVIGRGSNLIVRDFRLKGMVIRLGGKLAEAELVDGRNLCILAGAGLSIQKFLLWCKAQGLSGMEFLAGIPGTLGGAVFMNAGAFGKEICEHLVCVHIITSMGVKKVFPRAALEFSYRKLKMERGNLIARICFGVERGQRKEIAQRMGGFLKKRKIAQPLEFPSAGSVFKNPSGDYAGRLIEKAGLKGTRVGGAVISEKHANFIVNTGDASSADILALIDLAKRKVQEVFGVKLELEVQVVGE